MDRPQEHRRVLHPTPGGAGHLPVRVLPAAGVSPAVSQEGVRHKRTGKEPAENSSAAQEECWHHPFHPQVFVLPCQTSHLLKNLQYLDLSDNLLTDMTLEETLCNGNGTMRNLRVLNVSGNALKVSSRLVLCLFSVGAGSISSFCPSAV